MIKWMDTDFHTETAAPFSDPVAWIKGRHHRSRVVQSEDGATITIEWVDADCVSRSTEINADDAIRLVATEGALELPVLQMVHACNDNREVVSAALLRHDVDFPLIYASERLRGDRSIVLLAVKKSGHNLQDASKDLRNDPEIVELAKLGTENERLAALSTKQSSEIEKLRSENKRLAALCAVDVLDCTGASVETLRAAPPPFKRHRADVSGLKAVADAVTAVGEVTREVKIERDAAKTARDEAQRKLECPLCMDADISVCFLPCRHLLCGECGANVGTCPTCSTAIERRVSIFFP